MESIKLRFHLALGPEQILRHIYCCLNKSMSHLAFGASLLILEEEMHARLDIPLPSHLFRSYFITVTHCNANLRLIHSLSRVHLGTFVGGARSKGVPSFLFRLSGTYFLDSFCWASVRLSSCSRNVVSSELWHVCQHYYKFTECDWRLTLWPPFWTTNCHVTIVILTGFLRHEFNVNFLKPAYFFTFMNSLATTII